MKNRNHLHINICAPWLVYTNYGAQIVLLDFSILIFADPDSALMIGGKTEYIAGFPCIGDYLLHFQYHVIHIML